MNHTQDQHGLWEQLNISYWISNQPKEAILYEATDFWIRNDTNVINIHFACKRATSLIRGKGARAATRNKSKGPKNWCKEVKKAHPSVEITRVVSKQYQHSWGKLKKPVPAALRNHVCVCVRGHRFFFLLLRVRNLIRVWVRPRGPWAPSRVSFFNKKKKLKNWKQQKSVFLMKPRAPGPHTCAGLKQKLLRSVI